MHAQVLEHVAVGSLRHIGLPVWLRFLFLAIVLVEKAQQQDHNKKKGSPSEAAGQRHPSETTPAAP